MRLSLDERRRIETLVNRGICDAQIGYAIGRAPRVIGKELARAGGREGYMAEKAHMIATKNIEKSGENLLKSGKRSGNINKKVTLLQSETLYEQAKQLIEELQKITNKLEKIYDNIRATSY
jgi:IS30 family transposase